MDFVIEGLDPALFDAAFDKPPGQGVIALEADDDDYPCRISLEHAPRGDLLLLINFEHQPAATPYRSSHAIYVARSSRTKGHYPNCIPPVMQCRLLSVRAFNAAGMMTAATIVDGKVAASVIHELLDASDVDYLHIHFATRGCYAGLARRA